MDRDELAAWLRLALVPRLGPQGARQLLAAFGPPERIFSQSLAALAEVLGPRLAPAVQTGPPGFAEQLAHTLAWLEEDPAHRAVTHLADTAYPALLLQIEDPPLLLYRMGALDLPTQPAVAVVGSRNPTPQGAQNARAFARSLAEAGFTVTSGLALGVDAAAHEGALAGRQPGRACTVAVVGTGLDRVYPKQNHALARSIAEHGVLVSEYPLGTPPLAENFPRRNRLIAGLSHGTLVVEAALQSGSLITARLASEQGREVFAIPGSIHSPQSRGCHQLLRQGAKLVESAQDVLEDLRASVPGSGEAALAEAATPAGHPGDPLLEAMGFDPVGLDALQARTGWPTEQLQARLLELELGGRIGRLPGGQYQRTASA